MGGSVSRRSEVTLTTVASSFRRRRSRSAGPIELQVGRGQRVERDPGDADLAGALDPLIGDVQDLQGPLEPSSRHTSRMAGRSARPMMN